MVTDRPLRIALVHSFYRSELPSGENAVVLQQRDALIRHGHEVVLLARYSDDAVASPTFPLVAGLRVLTGHGPNPLVDLGSFRPDIVHVHNLFPGFGTRWLSESSAPIVATLHNFRPVCANGLLFRDGHWCTRCPDGEWTSAVRFGCYHSSRVQSIPLAVRNSTGVARDAVVSSATVLICPSEALRERYVGFGVPEEQLVVVPNGVDIASVGSRDVGSSGWLAAGRFTEEKGFRQLAEMWPPGVPLDIFGAGPEVSAIEAAAGPSVTVHAPVPRSVLLERMSISRGLVVPSRCLEAQPTVVTEALGMGLPVVAFRDNSVAMMVVAEGLGAAYSDAETLAAGVRAIEEDRAQMGLRARSFYESHLTERAWIDGLVAVYESVRRGR